MKAQTRYDLRPLFRVNFVDPDRSRSRALVLLAVQFGLPVAGGVGLGVWVHFGLDIQNGVSVALPAASLLVGAMFGAFVFLTNLRVKLAESATYGFRADLQRYVGSAAAACLYLALMAIMFAGMLALVGSLPVLRSLENTPWVVAVLVATAFHIGLTLTIVVRRLFVIYLDMFAADFNPRVPKISSSGQDHIPTTSSGIFIQPTRGSRKALGGR